MSDICVHCGKFATHYNKEGQPICLNCYKNPPKRYKCSKCGDIMVIKKGKYGSFWGCSGYPMCDHTVSLKRALEKEKSKRNKN